MPLYENCRQGLQTNDYEPPIVANQGSYKATLLVFPLIESDFTLINLINDGSPFYTQNKNTGDKSLQYGHQYFLVIKDSPAATKFGAD